MSGDYISREAAIKEVYRFDGYLDDDLEWRLHYALKRLPAADVVERPRWVSVTERLPEEDKWVLRYSAITEATWLAYLNSAGVWMDEQGEVHYVTHWMPLPEPPKEEAPAGPYDLLYEEGGPDA